MLRLDANSAYIFGVYLCIAVGTAMHITWFAELKLLNIDRRRAMQEVMLEHAREAAEARRQAELGKLPTEPVREWVFAWLHDGPHSGRRAVLAYNKSSSGLR